MNTATKKGYSGNLYEGENYQDVKNYSAKEIAKLIRKDVRELIKNELPGVKVSVISEYFSGGSSIDLRVKKVPFQLYNDEYIEHEKKNKHTVFNGQYYSDEAKALLERFKKIGHKYHRDDSDSMTDYFDVNFYWSVDYHWEYEAQIRDEISKGV